MPSFFYIPVIAIACTLYILGLVYFGPQLDDGSGIKLHFPNSVEELKPLAAQLIKYKEAYFGYVLLLFSSVYLYKQTFAIPGSVFLNLLAGSLFNLSLGFPLACVLTAWGATNCYLLSKYFGKQYVERAFPERIKYLRERIEANRNHLFFYMLFIRLFPLSPNWMINIAAPIVGVPISTFFLSIFFGLMPYNFICVQTGEVLSTISSMDEVLTTATFLKLTAMAVVAIVPGLVLKRRYKPEEVAASAAISAQALLVGPDDKTD